MTFIFFHKTSSLEYSLLSARKYFMNYGSNETKIPWWRSDGGVRFSCTGCGRCCSGEPGAVWLTQEEAEKLADRLGLDFESFSRRYCRILEGRLALREQLRVDRDKGAQYDCIFLSEGRFCNVYEDRPLQCRTFPYWPTALENRESWEALRLRGCEGIDLDERVSADVVEEQLLLAATCHGL
jgi:uncharacterized protein